MSDNRLSRGCIVLAAAVTLLLAGRTTLGDAYGDIVQYDWSQSRLPLATIEQEIRDAATPQARLAIEAKLLKALVHPQATYGCKQFVCRMLRRAGSPACVPALAKLLADPKLSHMARFALQCLPGEEAGAALRAGMATLSGNLKIGTITSIGARRDPKAVPALAKLVSGSDADLARAAIGALGDIANVEAARTLAGATVPAALKTPLADAYLRCADRMLADGEAAGAAAIYRKMGAGGYPKTVRIAALRGTVLAEKEKAVEALIALTADSDVDLRRAAGQFLIEMPGPAATKVMAAKLASMPADGQVTLLDALTARSDTAAAPQVTALVGSSDEGVRAAAIKALAVLGDASSVPTLAKAASAGGAVGEAALDALNHLKGEGVGEAMAKLMDSPDTAIRAGILGVLAVRADPVTAPAMVKAARDSDENIRKVAIKGLAAAAGEKQLPDIVALLVAAKSDSERSGLETALAAVAGRVADTEARAVPIVAGMARADAGAKARLITVLGRLGGAKALACVRSQLKASAAEVATEAVRALAAWPDAGPAPDLLNVIKTTKSKTQKVLAFRGYIRMANLAGAPGWAERGAAATTAMYKQALALATSVADKKSVLAGLAGARSADALKLVESLLADAALKAEAEVALVQVASNARGSAPTEVRAALTKVIASTQNAGLREKAQAIINEMDKYRGYLTSWLGSGPYTQGPPFNTAFAPEKDPKSAKWKVLSKGVGPQMIDLEKAIGTGENRAAYVLTNVWSPAAQAVRLEMGSDDGIKVWINGKLVHSNNATRGCTPGEDKAKAGLKQGWNTVLVKIAQAGGQWAFCIRIVKPDGSAIDGMKVSVEGK